jgi:CDGSH-type Zn-finger protein
VKKDFKITVEKDGPFVVEGGVPLANQHIVTNEGGESLEWREGQAFQTSKRYSLCRCGQSSTKPFCDQTHARIGFDWTETAGRRPFAEEVETFTGPQMVLEDVEHFCAFARFCDPHGQVWSLVEKTDQPLARKRVEHEAGHCPGGRLVAKERATGKALEPHFEPSLGLVQDTANMVSGPLWVRGGIPVIGADGVAYEVRNRVTLCRCGASKNKPFCNGSHATIGFKDGAEGD